MNERLSISKSLPLKARFYDYRHFTYPWHFHSEYEIIYVKESSGTRFVGNNVDRYSHGDIILLGSNLPHYMKSDDVYLSENQEERVRGTIIQFEKEFMYYSITHYPHFAKIRHLLEESQKGLYFSARNCPVLVDLLDKIPMETGLEQMISFLQLLKEMSETDKCETIAISDSADEGVYYDVSRIGKIISYLNKNYTRSIDLGEISSFAAMNPASFCRFFKNQTGKTFKNYILDMRIGYACKLLLMDDINISGISAECGFDTISHFNKTFRRNMGHSPSQYRKIMVVD